MNKLTVRDRVILCVLVAVISIFGYVKLVWSPLNSQIVAIKNEKTDLKVTLTDKSPLDQRLKQLHSDNEELVRQISEIKSAETAKTLTKEEFLVFLSDASKKSNSQIIKFNDLGLESDNGVWKATFDFRIRGTLKSINSVCKRIDMMGIRYSVGSMSLRQNERYPYLERNFDKFSNLGWYKDPIAPKEDETAETPSKDNDIIEPVIPEMSKIPEVMPEPTPTQPTPTPTPTPVPEPTPNTDNGNITDRLNDLLGLTSYRTSKYEVRFLTNTANYESSFSYDENNGDIMTLTVTIQLEMYEQPIAGSSIIITEEGENNNAVL